MISFAVCDLGQIDSEIMIKQNSLQNIKKKKKVEDFVKPKVDHFNFQELQKSQIVQLIRQDVPFVVLGHIFFRTELWDKI